MRHPGEACRRDYQRKRQTAAEQRRRVICVGHVTQDSGRIAFGAWAADGDRDVSLSDHIRAGADQLQAVAESPKRVGSD